MADETIPREGRVVFLHGALPNGAHCWAGFSTYEEFVRRAERLVPWCPPETVWDVTRSTYPRQQESTR